VKAGFHKDKTIFGLSSLNIKFSNKTPRVELLLYFTVVSGLPEKVERFNGKTHGSKAPVKEGKATPAQTWKGPEGFRRLRLPDFKTIGI
jgi:hypothetical protein